MSNELTLIALRKLRSELDPAGYSAIEPLEGGYRLVCAAKKNSSGQGGGNSFWVAQCRGRWYVVTWAPRFFECPPDVDILAVCQACLADPETRRWSISQVICAKYDLKEIESDPWEE